MSEVEQVARQRSQAELTTSTELEKPFGYFQAQVHFACKWAQITGESLADCLLKKTCLYRRLFNTKPKKGETDPRWAEVVSKALIFQDPNQMAEAMYGAYALIPHSHYTPDHIKPDTATQFGCLSYNPPDDQGIIKVHFSNRYSRSEPSALSSQRLAKLRDDVSRMFTYIYDHYPEAQTVLGGSWLYNLEAYRRIWPPTFTADMHPVPLEDMSYGGDSIWGQFVDSRGGCKQEMLAKFLDGVTTAQTTTDLIAAFPFLPFQPRDDIQNFYRHCGIGYEPVVDTSDP